MEKNIEEKLRDLSPASKKSFNIALMECLYSRGWCEGNNIDYVNPNISKVKEIVYNALFKRKQ